MLYYVRECRTPPYHVYVTCFVFEQEKALKGLDNASDYATSALEEHAPSRQAFKRREGVDKPSKEGKDGLIRGDASKK
jgi:hypothetical protein